MSYSNPYREERPYHCVWMKRKRREKVRERDGLGSDEVQFVSRGVEFPF